MTLIKELRFQPKSSTDRFKDMLNLSDEEKQIFDLVVRDKSITEISNIMMLSHSTVSRRLKNIRNKISCCDKEVV